jgi:UDPglucose 6-dehydrogenase
LNRISVFGLGPVGLVTAICFAKKGYFVVGIDPDSRKVETIRNGRAPFFEPLLDGHVAKAVANGTLQATSDSSTNAESDMAYITVGTPSKDDGSIDLTYVRNASTDIGQSLRKRDAYQVVLVKSTVTPGTARSMVKPILEEKSGKAAGKNFGLCSNPEFIREGNALYDSEYPDRIVIGSENQKDLDIVEDFYRKFYGDKTPTIVRTSCENAELIKYANNSFLAMKVSYINMFANLCQNIVGADVEDVARAIGLDKRIGPLFLQAGLGWGGSCFPKDLKAISAFGKTIGVKTPLVDAAIGLNDDQPSKAVELTTRLLGELKGKKVALLGLAFKPDTDDMREAVSVSVVRKLLALEAKVVAYDPAAMGNARTVFQDRISYANSAVECLDKADCCIIITEWREFKELPPEVFVKNMREPILIDGRRIYDPTVFMKSGIKFHAIGLGHLGSTQSLS